jgi:hypothetical protein
MRARRLLVGFIHRVVYAALFALLAWHACTWVFGESVAQRRIATAVCYAFNFPTAIVGRITAPYRGMDPFFDRGGEWCDFCSAQQMLWYHVRFAVPVYVGLFYLPNFVVWIVRRFRNSRSKESPVQTKAVEQT